MGEHAMAAIGHEAMLYIIQDYKDGVYLKDIAKTHGIGVVTLRAILKRMEVPKRERLKNQVRN